MYSISKIISEFNIPIQEIMIGEGLMLKAPDLIRNLGFENKKILLVTDKNIEKKINFVKNFESAWTPEQVLGDRLRVSTPYCHPALVAGSMRTKTNNNFQKLIFENPSASENFCQEIIKNSKNTDLIIGVGSGTINDLCKFASFTKKIPYIIFGTATSMNGYASANASLIQNGRKNSLPAHLPLAIYLDLDVLASAPSRLIKSGIGDSLCFSTCQFDWLLSHLILGTKYNPIPFDLLKNHHQKLLDFNGHINDKNFIKLLSEILIISGLGMYIAGGSYPASQAEHLISHYLELQYPETALKSHHGEQIAVTTLTMAKLQEKILEIKNLQIKKSKITYSIFKEIFDEKLADHFWQGCQEKIIDEKRMKIINKNLSENWINIRKNLHNIFIPEENLKKFSDKFDLPKKPEDIGISQNIYDEALSNAYLIRNRFTALDLLQLL